MKQGMHINDMTLDEIFEFILIPHRGTDKLVKDEIRARIAALEAALNGLVFPQVFSPDDIRILAIMSNHNGSLDSKIDDLEKAQKHARALLKGVK